MNWPKRIAAVASSLLVLSGLVACANEPPPSYDELRQVYAQHKAQLEKMVHVCRQHPGIFRIEKTFFGLSVSYRYSNLASNDLSREERLLIKDGFDAIEFDHQIDCGRGEVVAFHFREKKFLSIWRRSILKVEEGQKEKHPLYTDLDPPFWYMTDSDDDR